MQEWIIEFLNKFGYLGIALLIAVENVFPPIPSEIILTFGGFMTTLSDMNVWLVSLTATVGSVVGAVILYYIGRLIPPELLEKIVDKWGFILRVKNQDIRKAKKWFNRRGSITVFFCRFIPIIRSLISIPAGMTKMKLPRFLLYTTLGTALWNIVLVNLGAVAGENWGEIAGYVGDYSHVVLAVFAALLVVCVFYFAVKRRRPGNIDQDRND